MTEPKAQLRTLAKGLEALELIEAATTPLSLTELAALANESKPVMFRVLQTLEDKGYVQRRESDKRYFPTGRQTAAMAVPQLLALLSALGAGGARGVALADLSAQLGLAEFQLRELLVPLVEQGMVEPLGHELPRWRMTMKVLELAGPLLAETDLTSQLMPIMVRLADETGETLSLFRRSGDEHVLIAVQPSRQPVRYVLDVGQRFPLYLGAAGKAELSFLASAERERLLQHAAAADRSITAAAADRLRGQLDKVVAQGYATSVSERVDGATAAAAPIFSSSGAVCGVLSIMMPAFRADEARLHQCGALLLEALRGHLFADDHSPGWQTQKQHP